MIEIVKERKNKKKIQPYYNFKINYMIGDADGHTSEEEEIGLDNQYLEPLCNILDKLAPPHGRWGVSLDIEGFELQLKAKHITKEEYDFLMNCINSDDWGSDKFEEDDGEKLSLFGNMFKSETDYSFLTYEGYELTYIDEDGKSHNTNIK